MVLVRHGESDWNAERRFTGWVDVGLTVRGEEQAREAGQTMRRNGLLPDAVFTSVLLRSTRTASIVLEQCDRMWVPVERSWRLNERHYGALQGRSKDDYRDTRSHPALAELWARPLEVRPPPISAGDPWDTSGAPAYRRLAPDVLPRGESLHDVAERIIPYWYDVIRPTVLRSRCVLVVTHANVIRAIVARAAALDNADLAEMAVPSGSAIVYEWSSRHVRPAGHTVLYTRTGEDEHL
jgi:2,3-bisphosphoglycerate-dependent phosphoglycerate mutase